MAYPYGAPSSGFISFPDLNSSAFSPDNVTANITDNHSPVNKRTMVNSHGYQISLVQNFVNKQYLARESDPVISGFIDTLITNTANIDNIIVETLDAYNINTTQMIVSSGIIIDSIGELCFTSTYDGSSTCYRKDGITMDGYSSGKFDINIAMSSTYNVAGELHLKSGGSTYLNPEGNANIMPSGIIDLRTTGTYPISLNTEQAPILLESEYMMYITSPITIIGKDTSSTTHVNGHLSADYLDLPTIDVPTLVVDDIDLGNDIIGESDSNLCFHSDHDGSSTCYKKDGITMEGFSGGKFDINIAMGSLYKVGGEFDITAGGNLILTSTTGSVQLISAGSLDLTTTQPAPIRLMPGGSAPIYLTTKNDTPTIIEGGGLQGTFTESVIMTTTKQMLYSADDVISLSAPTISIGSTGDILYLDSAVHGILTIADSYGQSSITQSQTGTGGLWINSDTRNTTLYNHGFIVQSSDNIYLESSSTFEIKSGGVVSITSTSTSQPIVLTASQAIHLTSSTECTITAGAEIHIQGNGTGQNTISTVGNVELKSTTGQCDMTAQTNMYLTSSTSTIGIDGNQGVDIGAANGIIELHADQHNVGELQLYANNNMFLEVQNGDIVMNFDDHFYITAGTNATYKFKATNTTITGLSGNGIPDGDYLLFAKTTDTIPTPL